MQDKQKFTPISPEMFSGFLLSLGLNLLDEKNIAVAVSGGGDSLALCVLLSDWAADKGIKIHALTVDHGLRPESASEAKIVSKRVKALGVSHHILKWEGQKPKTKIQEAAREARYRLMSDYCQNKKIKFLFVAHHGQDQIETVLFRIAKGSGLDGLSGMNPVHLLENGLTLLRPLLGTAHGNLLATLTSRKIEWIEDPSNENNKYARVRIRNVIDVLENEGLSPARMSSLSKRVIDSISLINHLIDKEYKNMIINKDTQRIDINSSCLFSLPIEGKTRILKMIISDLNPDKKYPARLQDIERLASKLDDQFKGCTLGGCLFRQKKKILHIRLEKTTS